MRLADSAAKDPVWHQTCTETRMEAAISFGNVLVYVQILTVIVGSTGYTAKQLAREVLQPSAKSGRTQHGDAALLLRHAGETSSLSGSALLWLLS